MTAIERAEPEDAGEILTVQRAAYVSEAQLYGDPFIPPLVESADQIRRAVETATVLVARDGGRIVGAIRGRLSGTTCMVGRLVVAPDVAGAGPRRHPAGSPSRRGRLGPGVRPVHRPPVGGQPAALPPPRLPRDPQGADDDHLTLVHMRRQL